MIEVAMVGTADLRAVKSFYASVGYNCELGATDRILVARETVTIVAAVRLSAERDNLVLHGMYVSRALRGTGIGSQLLSRASSEIGLSVCWCVPYTHLE